MDKITAKQLIVDLMTYYDLDRISFAKKFDVPPSQVTRWLNSAQEPKLDTFFKLKEEWDKIKDKLPKTPPLLQMIS